MTRDGCACVEQSVPSLFLLAMPPRLLCHIDMNSYFASVEQQANPHLRGRPVGVCAYLHRYGCVIAASVEAKQQGMKVGMSMEEARTRVPSAVFVQNEPSKYRATTAKILRIFRELTPTVEVYSIDEAFLDLTGWCRDEAEAAFLVTRVKHRIATEVGEWLRCSAGIAPTRFLAKFASDRQKPNGLVILNHQNLDECLARAELEDACGIGPRIRRRLERLKIYSLLDLKQAPVGNLMRSFGKYGFYLWAKVNGIECERLQDGEPVPKTIGHSYCVPMSVHREKKVAAVLARLTERAGRRLRRHGLFAGAIVVTVGLRDQGTYRTECLRFCEPVADPWSLGDAASRTLHVCWKGEPVDFLAVTLVDLSRPTAQTRLPLIPTIASGLRTTDRLPALGRSLDVIRDKYGEQSVVFGRMLPLLDGDDHAADRIGFRKVELDTVAEVSDRGDAEIAWFPI